MNPLMLLLLMGLHGILQQQPQQQQPHGALGGMPTGQLPPNPWLGPGGAHMPGAPGMQGPQGFLQGRWGQFGPVTGGLQSLLNMSGSFPHQQQAQEPKTTTGGGGPLL